MGDPDMVVPELEGEGNLIAAVKQTMMALRSRKNLTDDEMEILGDLHTQLTTTITIGDRKADENNKIEGRLNVIEEKIMSWEMPMIWDSHLDQAAAYLNAAGEVRELNERLETLLCRNDDSKKKMLQRAQKVLQMAMKRVEEVFKHTLVKNRQPFEPNHASVFLSAADRVSKISPGDYLVENSDDRCIFNRNSEEFIIDLVQPDVISELRRIANLMFISGYGDECSLAYINLRRDAWNECLFNLEKEKPRIEDVLCSKRDNFKSELDSIKLKNKRWIQNMKIFVRVYLASEKWLSGQIFGELRTVNLVSLSGDLILLLFKYFGKDISIHPLNPEKLFHNLDIYEVLAGLHPNVDSLYSDKDISRVRVNSDEVLRGLAYSVRRALHEFPNYIVTYITRDSFANIPSEGIHPLTEYVMKYISTLADYSETLNFLLKDYDGEDPMLASPCKSSDVEEENISGSTSDFSPIAHFFRSNASIIKWLYSGSPMSSAMQEESISGDTSNEPKGQIQQRRCTAKVDEEKFRSLIGCLLYLTATRPDILHATSLLSRFMHCPSEIHMRAAKRILWYIKGTCSYRVKFQKCQELKLHGFSDSDWGGSIDDMKSTSGFCFNLGSAIFSWSSKKQDTVAQSIAKAEFIAATAAVNQALWLQKLLRDLHMEGEEATEISVDNQAVIAISHNPVFHGKTKHFNIKLYFLREVQKNSDVRLMYCKSEEQLADLFTKPLPVNRFAFLRQKIGVYSS